MLTAEPPDRAAQLGRLASVKGFDLAVALRNVGGNPAHLERVLRTFIGRYRDGDPALSHPAEPGNVARWRSACHSLRGACSTIGAASLPQGFAAFEASLLAVQADPAALAPLALALNDELMRVVKALAAALEGPAATS